MAQLPIASFLTEKLTEYDPNFELRSGTGFEALFFKPMEFIIQPLRDEANQLFIAQSFRRILQTDDPDSFDTESVDALASNLFVDRRQGGFSGGTGRAYFNEPVAKEYPANGAVFQGSGGQVYINPAPFNITVAEMSAQIEAGLYFYDIPLQAQAVGSTSDLLPTELVALVGDTDVVSVTNKLAFQGGVDTETNTNFILRVQGSIGVRDLVTGKGFNAILFENFVNFLLEAQPIGFGDTEMMRDIVYNTHIGGRVDGYVKTSAIQTGNKDFIGLIADGTRQTRTTRNIQLIGTNPAQLSATSIDRANGLAPVILEIKASAAAQFISSVYAAPPTTFNLSTHQHVRIGIDGTFKNIRIAGVIPSATNRNEVVNLINAALGINVASASGNYIKIISPTSGLTSQVVMDNPTIGVSALLIVFGLATSGAPYIYQGDGPVTYEEGIHYSIVDDAGTIARIVGASVLVPKTTGATASSTAFNDATTNIFVAVQPHDIITITTGPDVGDYRVLSKPGNNQLILDAELTTTASNVHYLINRTGIKSSETVYATFYFNPVSVDIGKFIKQDSLGKVRSIRPGRDEWTITDLAFLRITSVEALDPLTLEPTGTVLKGIGGYGQGGYGLGPYGIGSSADYRLVVNSPNERFSMFEDSYIVFNSALAGLSFRVNYEYVPEIESLHNFVRSESERVLDGDILMKHLLPSYVEGKIRYSVDTTDSSVPDAATVQDLVRAHITQLRSGADLQYSDLVQFITKVTDPFFKYGTFVEPITLTATIHNCDGTITKISGTDKLTIPTLDPFPGDTPRPLTPRMTHWIAEADLTIERF